MLYKSSLVKPIVFTAFVVIALLIGACGQLPKPSQDLYMKTSTDTKKVKFAQFNISFAHDGDPSEHFEQWIMFMQLDKSAQDQLIKGWKQSKLSASDKRLAERVMQIRNIAAIIQINRPDVLLLNEFNNDGVGKNLAAIIGFQQNYLSIPQSKSSIDGGEFLEPISYPFFETYATNTGLASTMDLNNNGYDEKDPNDAHGFGFYHGHYAFALLSKFEIDKANTRSFQHFKRKDLNEAVMPVINVCDGKRPLPTGMSCGDNWFSDDEWENLRLSSKNHVDVPINIVIGDTRKTIHALLSHPTPAAFDTFTDNNKYRNSEENAFWLHYINRSSDIYDDKGQAQGFTGDSFVIMGDQNADAHFSAAKDPRFNGIVRLMAHPRVNQSVAQISGDFIPTSLGAKNEQNRRNHPYPETRTSTFGARADYAVPSSDLKVLDSGVYWLAEGETGRLLFNDKRIGSRGADKQVSSDHRLVWVSIEIE